MSIAISYISKYYIISVSPNISQYPQIHISFNAYPQKTLYIIQYVPITPQICPNIPISPTTPVPAIPFTEHIHILISPKPIYSMQYIYIRAYPTKPIIILCSNTFHYPQYLIESADVCMYQIYHNIPKIPLYPFNILNTSRNQFLHPNTSPYTFIYPHYSTIPPI